MDHPDLSPGSAGAAATVDDDGLAHLALLVVRGPDARAFLDGQLTRNVPPTGDPASPAGYCSPKGRLLASFVMWADADADGSDAGSVAVSLVVSRDIAAGIARRLRMYVLRAKATIEEPADVRLDGFVDRAPGVETAPLWGVARTPRATVVRWPDADGRPRWLRVSKRAAGDEPAGVDAATWRWLDIRAGWPTITGAIQERFVPQMLNLEALGGVDFRKGCYPGQEVVARSQYLGKLKRRTAIGGLPASLDVPAAGSDVFAAGQTEPAGLVVAAERGPDGAIAALVELPLAAFASGSLRLGDAPLAVSAPPYPLPDNEVFVRPKL